MDRFASIPPMGSLGLGQSMNLDFLDTLELPEFVPVEDFYDEYVEELEARGQDLAMQTGRLRKQVESIFSLTIAIVLHAPVSGVVVLHVEACAQYAVLGVSRYFFFR
jgi:hypothetical protein